jgi:hypothetical protein
MPIGGMAEYIKEHKDTMKSCEDIKKDKQSYSR